VVGGVLRGGGRKVRRVDEPTGGGERDRRERMRLLFVVAGGGESGREVIGGGESGFPPRLLRPLRGGLLERERRPIGIALGEDGR